MLNVRVQRCATVLPASGQGSAPTRDDWATALASFNHSQAQLLKHDSGTAVYRTTLLNLDVVIKRWDLDSPFPRLKSLLRASRADRHWRGADWLLRHNIPTAQVYALARSTRTEWLVMQALEGKTLLEHIRDRDLSTTQEHALARALGSQIAVFKKAGAYNRDHKPSNLIVTRSGVAVIDCVAIRRGRNPSAMLASLLIEPTGCQLRIPRTLAMRVLTSYLAAADHPRESRNSLWQRVQRHIARHGDPTPRVSPLPPRLAPEPRTP